jgi:hypothetical protein
VEAQFQGWNKEFHLESVGGAEWGLYSIVSDKRGTPIRLKAIAFATVSAVSATFPVACTESGSTGPPASSSRSHPDLSEGSGKVGISRPVW